MAHFSKKTLGLALLSLSLLVAGGAMWWVKTHKVAPVVAGAVLVNPDAPFAVGECVARLYEDKPALAVMFSQNVDGAQALDQLIEVRDLGASAKSAKKKTSSEDDSESPSGVAPAAASVAASAQGELVKGELVKGGWITSDNPRVLLFPYVKAGREYRVQVNGALVAASGKKLEQGKSCTVLSDEMSPSFFFASKGTVLPAGLNGGLPVVTVNVPEVDVEFLRVAPEKLSKFVDMEESGIYVAVMRRPGHFDYEFQVTYFYVSDIGLHVRRFGKQTDVFTTSLKEGKAQGGVALSVLGEAGKVLLSAKTDGDGHGVLPELPDSARMLLAQRGKETSILVLQEPGLDLAEFDIGGHLPRDATLFVWSGRDLYRPGEKFTASLMVRSAEGIAVPAVPIKVELKKPSGDVVNSAIWQPNPKTPGYMQRQIDLPPDAATGKWTLELRADPSSKRADAIYSFQVEEFLPERMKLNLKSASTPLNQGEPFKVDVQGDYLYGAPAAGNRLLGSVAQERARNPLPKEWPGFIFGDFADDAKKQRKELDETALDDGGKAQVEVPFTTEANSPLKVRAAFSLLESGGRPVVRSIERIWWPEKNLIALRPAFDGDVTREGSMAEFEVIRVNDAGKFTGVRQADFKLVREDREYYWRYESGRGWHSGYSEAEETVHAGAIDLRNRAKLMVPVNWGRYRLEVRDPETELTVRYRFYAGWNAQDSENIGNRPDRVRLQLEGAPVKPGSDVKLKIVPPHDGEALVLVEADKVLWSKRIAVSTEGTSVTIPIDKNWNRSDMYISTVVFRPASQGDKVTPARAVGLTWLPLARDARKLKVALNAPAQVEPEKRMIAKIKVDNAAGKKAMITVSAVDLGILNITSFKTPDPFDFFFGKHRYGAELSDIYGKLIERMDGTPGKIKWGGDAAKRDTKSMPKKVKLIDLFSGPVQLNEKGEAEVHLQIPDFNGTLRL
ncbi:MAG: alpha-2-macroglobulin family protein, partial [Burkholderiales bacterium]|nr:alpha-2-macroglobulin family protein [Burkholderiales bacterium]